jgi:hypothetical protein
VPIPSLYPSFILFSSSSSSSSILLALSLSILIFLIFPLSFPLLTLLGVLVIVAIGFAYYRYLNGKDRAGGLPDNTAPVTSTLTTSDIEGPVMGDPQGREKIVNGDMDEVDLSQGVSLSDSGRNMI